MTEKHLFATLNHSMKENAVRSVPRSCLPNLHFCAPGLHLKVVSTVSYFCKRESGILQKGEMWSSESYNDGTQRKVEITW